MSGTAKHVRNLPEFITDAALYQVDPPLSGNEFVIVSAMEEGMPPETYIFPADEDGQMLDSGELPGSRRGIRDHAAALAGAGYEVIE